METTQSDIAQIRAIRHDSNQAIKSHHPELDYRFLTNDVHITTGNGDLIHGKRKLKAYIGNIDNYDTYWVRTPNEIEVNITEGLAWETGVWHGYDMENENTPVMHGKYSAMWIKTSGKWLIKSQLFVSLD